MGAFILGRWKNIANYGIISEVNEMEYIMGHCYEPDLEEIDPIICNRCKHRREGITCDAFPDGIPIEIIRSGAHFLPVDGDNGIVFEEKDDTDKNGTVS